MDECDTASAILQCGQEQAPNLVSNIIDSVALNSSAVDLLLPILYFEAKSDHFYFLQESVPLPSKTHKCLADFECIFDVR